MQESIIENKRIVIRDTREGDLDWVITTEGHPDNRDYVYNWSMERHRKCMESTDEKHFIIEEQGEHRRIGYIILSGLDSEHDVISFDRITIADKGRGYGREAVRLIKDLCFQQYGCHRLWLDVFDFNPQARQLYESEGFIFEGTLRECKKREGKHLSMHVLSMLAQEYEKNR